METAQEYVNQFNGTKEANTQPQKPDPQPQPSSVILEEARRHAEESGTASPGMKEYLKAKGFN